MWADTTPADRRAWHCDERQHYRTAGHLAVVSRVGETIAAVVTRDDIDIVERDDFATLADGQCWAEDTIEALIA
ncbi:hypothetical protein [Nocardia salmonicida]|uniref:hypothetical protein n=1 Tax=Nocardia salmonicida TaxID=53431 RepID=UPI003629E014